MLDYGRREAELLKNDRDFQTELFGVLGRLYEDLGRYDQADRLLQATWTSQSVGKKATAKARAETLISLGLLRKDQSRFPEAERLVQQGLDLLRQDAKANPRDVARGEAALGDVLVAREDFKRAIPALENAVRIQGSSAQRAT